MTKTNTMRTSWRHPFICNRDGYVFSVGNGKSHFFRQGNHNIYFDKASRILDYFFLAVALYIHRDFHTRLVALLIILRDHKDKCNFRNLTQTRRSLQSPTSTDHFLRTISVPLKSIFPLIELCYKLHQVKS